MTSKVQPAADYWTVDRENLGTRLCYTWWAEKQKAKRRNSFKNEEMFWMNGKAIIEFGFRRIWRILQISEGVIHLGLWPWPLWITPFLICRLLHILRKPHLIIAKYTSYCLYFNICFLLSLSLYLGGCCCLQPLTRLFAPQALLYLIPHINRGFLTW